MARAMKLPKNAALEYYIRQGGKVEDLSKLLRLILTHKDVAEYFAVTMQRRPAYAITFRAALELLNIQAAAKNYSTPVFTKELEKPTQQNGADSYMNLAYLVAVAKTEIKEKTPPVAQDKIADFTPAPVAQNYDFELEIPQSYACKTKPAPTPAPSKPDAEFVDEQSWLWKMCLKVAKGIEGMIAANLGRKR